MNPFIARGAVPEVSGGSGINPLVVQPLMMRSLDEPFTLYGLVPRRSRPHRTAPGSSSAQSGGTLRRRQAGHRGGCALHVRAAAREGTAGAAKRLSAGQGSACPRRKDDPLRLRGARRRAAAPARADAGAREARRQGRDFDQPSFRPPLGSGPYALAEIEPGKTFTLRRRPDFWGKDLPILKGHHNFDEIRVDFYRDATRCSKPSRSASPMCASRRTPANGSMATGSRRSATGRWSRIRCASRRRAA